ncbi:MAG: hypothetical protein AAFR46_06090 [Pseudomonadota bacterium]
MGEAYETFTFPHVAPDRSAAVKDRLLQALWAAEIVARENAPARVLWGAARIEDVLPEAEPETRAEKQAKLRTAEAYPPLPFYGPNSLDTRLWPMQAVPLGLEVTQGPSVSGLEFDDVDGFTCPSCAGSLGPDRMMPQVLDGIGGFFEHGTHPVLTCPLCHAAQDWRDWRLDGPGLSFTHLGLTFWNWPSLDAPDCWRLDVPALMSRAAASPMLRFAGKL